MQPNPKAFRYDINGLRAIAIMGVLLFHYKVAAFEGGFAGVDVFFVISGYLMSRVVMGQVSRGTFLFSDYFERRLHRIVPALLVLVVAVIAVCFFIYLPADYKPNVDNGASSILFFSNIFYWYNAPSYFDAATDTNLFLHTWSLSVEWQFYLVYPFVLLLLNRLFKNIRTYRMVFIGLTVISFVAAIVTSGHDSSFSFYMLPTRAWEMLLGGLAFFAEGKIKGVLWQRTAAIAGYLIIITCFLTLNDTLPWPGFYTLLPVSGTFLIIVANYNNFKVIKHGSFQFISKISYSLYLWHWPVFVIAQYYGLGTGFAAVAGYCILSTGLAWLSYRYIETIAFKGKIRLVVCVPVLSVCVFALGYFDANSALYSKKTLEIAGYKMKTDPFYAQFRKDTCFSEGLKKFRKDPCLCFEEGKPNILLIGDSHLAQLSQSLREGFKGVNFLQATAPATLPTVTSYYDKANNYRDVMDFIYYDFIPKNAGKIDGVVISANWAGQHAVGPEGSLKGIKEAIAYLKRYNIPIVIIGQTERYTVTYPVVAARAHNSGTPNNTFYLDGYTQEVNGYLASHLKGVYIDVLATEAFLALSSEHEPYMRDKDHFTKYGADLLVARIKENEVWVKFLDGR